MKRIFVALAVVSAVALSLAQSPPPQTPAEAAQINQNIGGVKKPPTQSTTAIPQIPATIINQPPYSTPTKTETTKKGDTKGNEAPFSWSNLLMVIFTGVLTGVGILQWISMSKQADYMRRGLPVSIKAARSARFSAIAARNAVRNTVVTERAAVLLDDVSALPLPSDGPYLHHTSIIVFTVKNFGGTEARSVKVKGHIRFPTGSMEIHERPESTIPPQGVGKFITYSLGAGHITTDAMRVLNNEHGKLYYTIEVTYIDVFDQPHTYKAEGQYIPTLSAFIVTSSKLD